MKEIIETLKLNREDKCIDFHSKKCPFGCWNCTLTFLLLEIIDSRKTDQELMDLITEAIK